MAEIKFRLTLIRHGQTNHNRLRILQGQLDPQLNELGREQASLLARHFKRLGVHHNQIYSSDLSRAGETAQIICAGDAKRASQIRFESLLRERSYGKLQGLPIGVIHEMAAAAAAQTPASYKTSHVIAAPGPSSWGPVSKIDRPEGGETLDEVRTRVETFCDQVLLPNVGHHQHVLVVSHGGTIREFMRVFKYRYGAQIKFQELAMTPNTGVSEFDVWLDERGRIERVRTICLHSLPHLTFDVFNRDNPHVNLNNLHLRTAIQLKDSEKRPDL